MLASMPTLEKVGPYRIIRKLGEGGGGFVWLAERTYRFEGGTQNRLVALKEPRLTDLESIQQNEANLKREFTNGVRVNHPNVLKILDIARYGQRLFIEMEYIEGRTACALLEAAQDKGCLLPMLTVAELGAATAAGLRAIHDATSPEGMPLGLVHRDIKPENLMVDLQGGVKVLDLGIVRGVLPTSRHTAMQVIRGTPLYMAPEQHLDRTLGPQADIFALGVVMFELAAGTPLFADLDGSGLLQQKQSGEAHERMAAYALQLGALLPIIARCVDPAVDRRYARAGDLENDLRALLAQHPLGPGLRGLMQIMNGVPLSPKGLDPSWRALIRRFTVVRQPIGFDAVMADLGLESVQPLHTLPMSRTDLLAFQARLKGDSAPPLGGGEDTHTPPPRITPPRIAAPRIAAPHIDPPSIDPPRIEGPGVVPARIPPSDDTFVHDEVDLGLYPYDLDSGATDQTLIHEGQQQAEPSPPSPPPKNRRWHRALWLLLLIPCILCAGRIPWSSLPWGKGPMAAPDLQPCYADQDKDGYGGRALQLASQQCSSPKGVLRAGDCDDQDPTVYPRARELTDGRDNDCDGRLVHQERDRDGDGLFASEDCDDLDALRHKGADEHPADGVDQDCDGQELCYQDLDRDLWGSTETVPGDLSCQGLRVAARSGDCEDRSAQIAPELPERADGKDSDCDGVVDEGAIVTMDPAPPQKPTPSPDVTGPPPVQLRTPKLPLPPYAKLAVEGVLANKKTTLEVSGTILDPDKRCRSPSMVWKSTNPSALEHVVQLSSWSPDRGTFNIQVPIAGDGITRITYTISCRVDGVPTRLQIANGTSWFYVSR